MAAYYYIWQLLDLARTADVAFASRTYLGLLVAGAEPDGPLPRGWRQRCIGQSVGHAGVGL